MEFLQRIFKRFRHTQLLLMLSLLMLASPFLRGGWLSGAADALLLVTFLSAVFAFADRKIHVVVGLLLTVAIQSATWYRDYNEIESVSIVFSVLSISFFGYLCALVLHDVFRARDVSFDTIAGALSVYLVLGVVWAFGYALLESLVPGSIIGLREEGAAGYAQYLGYSFVTLTTLGYGNVVPGNTKADIMASAEAIVGQLYLTVLVARLVAMSLSAGRAAREPDVDDSSD